MNGQKTSNEKKWYAIYTKSRNEKKVAETLSAKGIEVYLPLLRTLRQWSDRKKKVEIPLFRGYLFVYIFDKKYLEVLQTDGVVRFITFRNERISIPLYQIEAVKAYLNEEEPVSQETIDYIPGDFVEVARGPMKGLQGTLVKFKGKRRVLMEIESIGQHLFLDLPKSILEKITGPH